MWKSDIEIFALALLPPFPPLLPKPLLPALLFSLIEFNSAQGDSVIDRLREIEEIWFKLSFYTVHILCQIFLLLFSFFYCALGFAIDSLLPLLLSSLSLHTFPPH